MNKFLMLILMLLALVLGACDEDLSYSMDEEDKIQVTTNVSGLSDAYENALRMHTDEMNYYMNEFNTHMKNKTLASDESKQMLKEGIIFASEFSLYPTTQEDKVVNDIAFKVNYHFKNKFEYALKYINTREQAYSDLSTDANNDYNYEVSIMQELLIKYGVNGD